MPRNKSILMTPDEEDDFDFWSDVVSAERDGLVSPTHAYSPGFQERLGQAVSFAAKLHGWQARKGTNIYYISHPLAVASIVMEAEGPEASVYGALFHDLIEDTTVDPKAISKHFGKRVLEIVQACSDKEHGQKTGTWRERKEGYLARLGEKEDRDILLVVLADKIHNARSIFLDHLSIGKKVWERFPENRYLDYPWYYGSILKILESKFSESTQPGEQRLLSEFRFWVTRLKELVKRDSPKRKKARRPSLTSRSKKR